MQNGERTIGNKIFFSSLPFASRKRKEKKKKRNISRQCETARLNFLRLPTTLYVIPCLYLCIPLFCAVRTTIYATSIVWGGTPELTCGVLMVSFEGAHWSYNGPITGIYTATFAVAAGPLPGKSYSSTDELKWTDCWLPPPPPFQRRSFGVKPFSHGLSTGLVDHYRIPGYVAQRVTQPPLMHRFVSYREPARSLVRRGGAPVQFTVQRSPGLLRGFFFFHSFGEGVARSDVVPRLRGSCLVKSFPDVIPIRASRISYATISSDRFLSDLSSLEIGRKKDISRPCRRSL